MDYGIRNTDGEIILTSDSRTSVQILSRTNRLAGTPVRFAFGEWCTIVDDDTDVIRFDRLSSEFCGVCDTHHHPDSECKDQHQP